VEYYWDGLSRGLEKMNGATEIQVRPEIKAKHGKEFFSDKPDLLMIDSSGQQVSINFDWGSEFGFSASTILGSMKYVVDELSLQQNSGDKGHVSIRITPDEEPKEVNLEKNKEIVEGVLKKVSTLQEQRLFGMGVPEGLSSKQDWTTAPLATTHYSEAVLKDKWKATLHE
jgi:hypothetical protein